MMVFIFNFYLFYVIIVPKFFGLQMKTGDIFTIVWKDEMIDKDCFFIKKERGFLIFRRNAKVYPVRETSLKQLIKTGEIA